ncbi:SGNH/GDSL hydrolase family protein [Paracidovorax wautersii]|uniref:Outer membrane lipase/esterase n=1 Tax=Paracidovorax wautersii TaxID=1177982 RepID=A0ABU1I9N8_9BURK|nr:SGNH/GDSL hydrolase family protein [Paracidovorax wautersii]MDR6213946.1 outer membrane lipase/esterase [Paracidovorax wautersii]
MAANWMRRTLVVAACASATLLAACGSSTTESAISPSRFVTFGDGFTDMGQTGSRYTVNGTGAVDNWANQLASRYGRTITPQVSGGAGFAQGNARVTATTDAAGGTAPSIEAQITSFLNTGRFSAEDLVIVNGGISDLIVGMTAVTAGTSTVDQFNAAATTAGRELGAQVERLVAAGAQYVLVTNTYNLGRTPWAITIGQTNTLNAATRAFNDALKIRIESLGKNVLIVDAESYFNDMTFSPGNFSMDNSTAAVCTSVDPGNGIGTGAGQVNSARCTPSTLLPAADSNRFVFADNVYPAPSAHRQFGDWAYDRLRNRW